MPSTRLEAGEREADNSSDHRNRHADSTAAADGPRDLPSAGPPGDHRAVDEMPTRPEAAPAPLSGFACRDGAESLVLGERDDGSIVHISEVPSGRACLCVCPGCAAPLVARKGRVNDHHFAHAGSADGSPCRTGPETALHKFAKEILGRRLHLALPALALEEDGDRWIRYGGGVHAFDAAILERRLGDIVPDVIVRRGDRDLLVEFAVTHTCEPAKIERIRDLDVAAVEIDLSKVPRDAGRAELEAAILGSAPRVWLHNPLLAEGRAELGRRRQARADALARRGRDLAAAYELAAGEVRAMKPSDPAFATIGRDGFGPAVGLEVRGQGCFTVAAGDWQAILLTGIFEAHRLQGTWTFGAGRGLGRLARLGLLRPRFARLADTEVAAAKAADDRFGTPLEAIRAWASALTLLGILSPMKDGVWQLRGVAIAKADEALRRRLLPARRREEIGRIVSGILSGMPPEEADGFSFERWLDAPLPGFDHTMRQALDFGDVDYGRLKDRLDRIARDVRYGQSLPDERLGLPLDGVAARKAELERSRAEQRRREADARVEAEADARVERLMSRAGEHLGSDVASWAAIGNPSLRGTSPSAAARSGESGLMAAVDAAREMARLRALEGRAAVEAEEARTALRREAARIVPAAQLDVYLKCRHPALDGKSPLDFCTAPGLVRRCLQATLPVKPNRRR
ncbi:hypothetical protein PQI07_27920 [Methylobacterium sp. 092160098-2]|uniref:hypothetical protein n=1 Tax=Methylobacterium sp. 092160098-2 TaxID=3025129 RepID=UPI002381CD35|nr:hypothetical protein [Methylobacterium sp. 092160098-2]MDE4914496.1 hypothetical protein [Methylobacterium sp. 092160098-2]